MYIGETRRTVHQRVNELRHTIKRKDLMPWNDPHTAAPSLWAFEIRFGMASDDPGSFALV
ncbi:MAG: hypothetical protein Q8S57_10460 [Methanoregula sp.]|nr:hypothetical protein [Methanoregula sp.]